MALPPKWYQFLISVFASLGSALYGYDLGEQFLLSYRWILLLTFLPGVIAGAVNSKNFGRVFSPTANETGAVVSVFTGGAFFGAALAGPAGDWLGRKKTASITHRSTKTKAADPVRLLDSRRQHCVLTRGLSPDRCAGLELSLCR